MIKVGLVGFGKAGQAVAQVLQDDPRYELCWIARRTVVTSAQTAPAIDVPMVALATPDDWGQWLDTHPVDALVDFSHPESLHLYGEQVRARRLMLVSAISAYSAADLDYAHVLASDARVLSSPNITVGINFLIMAARLIHNSIERRAFGTGAAFALAELAQCGNGFYTFDDLMMRMVRKELLSNPQ